MRNFRRLAAAAAFAAALMLAPSLMSTRAQAQELSTEHVALAVEVVRSAGATGGFDAVLPRLASRVIDRLINLRPDLYKEIAAATEAVALKLAVRRTELDTEVGRIWAQNFNEEELKTLLAFYNSDAGKKFSRVGPVMVQQSLQAVERWSQRVGAELLDKTREELRNQGIEISG